VSLTNAVHPIISKALSGLSFLPDNESLSATRGLVPHSTPAVAMTRRFLCRGNLEQLDLIDVDLDIKGWIDEHSSNLWFDHAAAKLRAAPDGKVCRSVRNHSS